MTIRCVAASESAGTRQFPVRGYRLFSSKAATPKGSCEPTAPPPRSALKRCNCSPTHPSYPHVKSHATVAAMRFSTSLNTMATKQMPHGTHGFDRRPLQISRPAQATIFAICNFTGLTCFAGGRRHFSASSSAVSQAPER